MEILHNAIVCPLFQSTQILSKLRNRSFPMIKLVFLLAIWALPIYFSVSLFQSVSLIALLTTLDTSELECLCQRGKEPP